MINMTKRINIINPLLFELAEIIFFLLLDKISLLNNFASFGTNKYSSTRIIINPNPMFSKKLFIFIILINILR